MEITQKDLKTQDKLKCIEKEKKKQVRQWRELTYIHTCRSYIHTPRHILQTFLNLTNGASLAWSLRRRITTAMLTSGWAWPARWPICPIMGFWESKVHKKIDFPPWTPMNRLAKCDAASFILGGDIRIRTNTHTNSKRYTHTLSL